MEIKVAKTELAEIQGFRKLFLEENKFQFVYNKCHLYGWADTYLFLVDGIKIGYGGLWGEKRDIIFEFYTMPPYRKFSNEVFQEFCLVSLASSIQCQSNDQLLSCMLFEYAENIVAEAILFEDHFQTNLSIPGVIFTKKPMEEPSQADMSGYVLEQNAETVATGGFMLNYNMPYADIYMEVKEQFRQKGFGSLIIQELKKEVYLMGRVPSARCNISNHASRTSLLKAGFRQCGFLMRAEIKKSFE